MNMLASAFPAVMALTLSSTEKDALNGLMTFAASFGGATIGGSDVVQSVYKAVKQEAPPQKWLLKIAQTYAKLSSNPNAAAMIPDFLSAILEKQGVKMDALASLAKKISPAVDIAIEGETDADVVVGFLNQASERVINSDHLAPPTQAKVYCPYCSKPFFV